MLRYVCRYLGSGDELTKISGRDAHRVLFRFSLTPAEFFEAPDGATHAEDREACVSVTGRAIRSGAVPKDKRDMMAVLYWHAVKLIENGEVALEISCEYAVAHPVDPSKTTFLGLEGVRFKWRSIRIPSIR